MVNTKLVVAIGTFLAALATLTSAIADSQLPRIEREIRLKDKAEVWSQTVCLGDLVEDGWLQSRCAIDRSLCCRWSLNGSRVRALKLAELQSEIAKVDFAGFSLMAKGTNEVIVTQTRRELSAEEIRAKVIAAASQKVEGEGTATVTSLKLPSPVYVRLDSESAWDVILPEQLVERATVKIISTDQNSQQLGWAQVTLKVESDVYVAKKTIHPSEALKPEDFEIRKADILAAQTAGNALVSRSQFPESVRARITILAGVPLTAALIERIPMVRLGDTVTLLLRSDNLRISTKAIVQGAAGLGDMVTVQLHRLNRTFRGRLIEGRLVEVWL